jgi:hypothetical protein
MIIAEFDNPHLIRRAIVVYETSARPGALSVELRRSPAGNAVAEIPSEDVAAPELRYSIEIERTDGVRQSMFASRSDWQRVVVLSDRIDDRERVMLARVDGRRSVFSASADYVDFGRSDSGTPGETVKDNYFRIEAGYAFRPLRIITEFGLRIGVVRGRSPVPLEDAQAAGASDPYKVGLNYGAPYLRFAALDELHFDAELLTSVTEVGFSLGSGGAMIMGDPYGNNLTLGFESIQVFGTRFYSKLDVAANRRIRVSPIIEVTDMPHANGFGVRLIAEVGLYLGSGFGVTARGGYQARTSTAGGPAAGLGLSYSF